jgi:two-component system alkaline phosphatase synthesis response regulator PhoP
MIYYVEDDTNIRELALYALRQSGLDAEGFAQAAPFFEACRTQVPDLVLLDIMLPGTDGLQILEQLRHDAQTATVPIMMLTAKGTELDKVIGLDAGADDYLGKPFGMMELVSRCKALLRRAKLNGSEPESALVCGPIQMDVAAHEVHVGGKLVDLTLKEFELLRALMTHEGQALSRGQLLEDVWNITFAGETRTVDAHVQTLRHKLSIACPGAEHLIQTVRGVGYRIRRSEA